MNNHTYCCDKCKYSTNTKQNYNKHLLSKKHNQENSHQIIESNFICSNCEKRYKYRAGLWNHCRICIIKPQHNEKKQNVVKELRDEIKKQNVNIEKHQDIIEKTNENVESLKNLIIEMCKTQLIPQNFITNNNNNNNNFNITIFLEKCKNAINFTDFINAVKIELDDIRTIGDIGYIKGVSQIISDRLKSHSIYERPIHYYSKNDFDNVIHIKDEDTWRNEHEEVKTVIDKNIYKLDTKLIDKIMVLENKTGEQFKKERDELLIHGGLYKENKNEQIEITKDIVEKVKIPR